MEWRTHGGGYFVTLTYNDDSIPVAHGPDGAAVQTLDKKRTLKWLNNCQSDLGSFRYYLVGEYGDTTGRPHYHMALFPTSDSQLGPILERWQDRGFTSHSEITTQRARYLARYTAKKLTAPNDPRLDGREPEFRTSSRRPPLGAEFCDAIVNHYTKRQGAALIAEQGDIARTFRIDGQIYPIGDWALKKIRTELGIPTRHSDRLMHPNYEKYNPILEATCLPDEAMAMEAKLNAKAKQQHHRSSTRNI